MTPDVLIALAVLAICVFCLIVGVLIGVGIGRDDQRARESDNRCFIDALSRRDIRPLR